MRNNRKKSVHIIALLLAILMVLTLFTGIFSTLVQGRNLADIDREIGQARSQMNDLENRTGALQTQREEIGGRLTTLRAQEGSYLEELAVLQEQLELLREQIALTEEQIALYKQMIEVKEERLAEATAREEEQLQLYRRRIRAMEERGPMSYIQILLRAQSFSDLVARIHDAEEIVAFDQRVADQLERYRVAVQEYRDELLADQAELEILIARLEAEREELEKEEAEVERRIREVEERIAAQEIAMAELEAEYERMQEEMQRITRNLGALDADRQEALRALEAQVAAGGSPGGGGMVNPSALPRQGTGPFVWPSSHTGNVTSRFGWRIHPITGQNRHHNGIDIAAPGINGTPVIAAASGIVVQSRWNGGFGNFILINHGNGYATLYAHNSANLVSAGTPVVQGQIIGRVGSTGNSTGPHIHFEVHRNGTPVDPMNYFVR